MVRDANSRTKHLGRLCIFGERRTRDRSDLGRCIRRVQLRASIDRMHGLSAWWVTGMTTRKFQIRRTQRISGVGEPCRIERGTACVVETRHI